MFFIKIILKILTKKKILINNLKNYRILMPSSTNKIIQGILNMIEILFNNLRTT